MAQSTIIRESLGVHAAGAASWCGASGGGIPGRMKHGSPPRVCRTRLHSVNQVFKTVGYGGPPCATTSASTLVALLMTAFISSK